MKKMLIVLSSLVVMIVVLHPLPAFTGQKNWKVDEKEYTEESYTPDPLEPINRLSFEFNDKLYFWLLKPVGKFYSDVVPADLRVIIKNFFYNITTPVRVVNSILQGRLSRATNEVVRFGINTTLGAGGLGDPAGVDFGFKKEPTEDLGQTLGSYGIKHGFYIVWPVLGPSSLRDTLGLLGDAFLDPVNYIEELSLKAGLKGTDKINSLSFHIGDYESLKESAIDPYISLQDAYLQKRAQEVKR